MTLVHSEHCASHSGIRPTIAEIDLGAIAANYQAVHEFVATDVWAVVKADAYGHGAIPVAQTLASHGASGFCVALVEEGISLRESNITQPILVMSGVYRDGLGEALAYGLTPVIHDESQLDELTRLAKTRSVDAPVQFHLKVDTGMSRLGIVAARLSAVLERLSGVKGIELTGLMTHFANADCDDPSFSDVQLERFFAAKQRVLQAGHTGFALHACNSAGAFRFPHARLSAVRSGIALYGVAPFPHDGPSLLPAFRLKTEVLALREVPAGTPVGYAGAFVCDKTTILATIPIGYADGFFRRLSSSAEVLIRGGRARVVGNVSMDMASVDVTEIAADRGVVVGDEVVLLGTQNYRDRHDSIRAEEIASRAGTIAYEVLCALSRRVPRAYGGADLLKGLTHG